jgi:hypothetical protein
MANNERGQIAADFEGKRINLMLSTNAMCSVEAEEKRRAYLEAHDLKIPLDLVKPRKIGGIVEALGLGADAAMADVRLIFWGMMLDAKPDATDADAGRLIDSLRGKHDQVMIDAINCAFPDPGEDDDEGDASGK